MNQLLTDSIKSIIRRIPAVIPYLTGRARWIAFAHGGEYKTYEFFLGTVQRLVRDVYGGFLGGEFIDIMANLIQGQINQAYQTAWNEEGAGGVLPEYLETAAQNDILYQYNFVDQFYRDIVDARIDGTSIQPLLSRAELWANRYNESYNNAVVLITMEMGGNLEWVEGPTSEPCSICPQLNGIVARALEWDSLGVKPQNAPNPILATERGGCGGWNCLCELRPTDKRRSPKAYETIMNIVGR
jgi:hypothetical protein